MGVRKHVQHDACVIALGYYIESDLVLIAPRFANKERSSRLWALTHAQLVAVALLRQQVLVP